MHLFDSFQLLYHRDTGVLEGRWLGETPTTDLPEHYRALLEAAVTYQATHWLLEVRRPTPVDLGIRHWFVQEFLPRAAQALAPARLRMAYIMPAAAVAVLAPNGPAVHLPAPYQHTPLPCDLHLFDSEKEALRWLLA